MAHKVKRDTNYQGNRGGECSPVERLAQCLRVDWECPYCGADLHRVKIISMDHVLPQLFGGQKSDTNIIACCGSCNSSKQARLLREFAQRRDPAIVTRVRRIQRRRLAPYLAQANKILKGPEGR